PKRRGSHSLSPARGLRADCKTPNSQRLSRAELPIRSAPGWSRTPRTLGVGSWLFGSSHESVDLHASAKLIVLVADELDDLVVGRDLLIDANREWLRVGLRVLEGQIDFEPAVRGPANALGEFRPVRIRAAPHVEPAIERTRLRAAQIVCLDHERVAFPAPH